MIGGCIGLVIVLSLVNIELLRLAVVSLKVNQEKHGIT